MLRLLCLLTLAWFPFVQVQATCVKGNCKDGYGTYVYTNGDKYVGDFKDSHPEGKGIIYFANGNKYIGHWQHSFRQGEGRFVYSEGHEYLGQFRQNKFHGFGKMSFANGDRYEGYWESDRPNGKGIYFFASGKRFEGTFFQGRFHGPGVMFYADGTSSQGQWVNGKRNGVAEEVATDLLKNESNVADQEKIESPEKYTAQEEATENGPYDRNCNRVFCATGKGTYTYSDGSRYLGEFYNGQPEGEGTVYYANGDKYKGGWKEHTPHGKGIMHYKDGRVLGAIWNLGRPVEALPPQDAAVQVSNVQKDLNDQVKIWAVLVGVSRYDQMPVLSYTDDDAYNLFGFLKSPEGGALPDEQIQVLIDEDATRYNIIRAMRETFLKADANDVVLFYFSGHGLQGAFLPTDYDGFNNRLLHQDVRDILMESEAKHKLVLADACHSGSLLAARMPIQDALDKYYQAFEATNGGIALFMSSKGEEYSLEDSGLRSGIFSHYLIQGLKGAADKNGDRIITIMELYDFVYTKVRAYTAGAQTPTLSGSFDNRMPVAVRR